MVVLRGVLEGVLESVLKKKEQEQCNGDQVWFIYLVTGGCCYCVSSFALK